MVRRKPAGQQGLDVIARKANHVDLGLIRDMLRSGYVDYSGTDIEFLRRFGEWIDIPLIVETLTHPEAGRTYSLLSGVNSVKYRAAARAIYALGQGRLREVLAMAMPSSLLSQLIREVSDRSFRDLDDMTVIKLLQSESHAVRKIAAVKSIRAVPKRRISKLLTACLSADQIYYNVIHWLDLGVSAPRERVSSVVDKILRDDV